MYVGSVEGLGVVFFNRLLREAVVDLFPCKAAPIAVAYSAFAGIIKLTLYSWEKDFRTCLPKSIRVRFPVTTIVSI